MEKIMSLLGILICLGLAFYFDSSTANVTNEFRSSILYTPEEMEAVAIQNEDTQTVSDPTQSMIPDLEYFLENKEEVNGYIIETYREYEIYTDENGNTMKKVPTSHYDYLRYKK